VTVEKRKPGRVAGFCQDITQAKTLEARVLEISEREQRRIGWDLHDGLSQQLAGIGNLTRGLLARLRSASRPEAEEAARIVEWVGEACEQARSVSRGLVPVRPEPNGLVVALRRLVETVESTRAVRCLFKCRARVRTSDDGVATHLYRIAQEAVNNAVRHAKARRILLQMYRDREGLHLVVEDDGLGMPSGHNATRGMGLETMEHRAKAINAQLSLRSEPGRGTRLHCCLPGHSKANQSDLPPA
jgi:signal transduction histidine kinase